MTVRNNKPNNSGMNNIKHKILNSTTVNQFSFSENNFEAGIRPAFKVGCHDHVGVPRDEFEAVLAQQFGDFRVALEIFAIITLVEFNPNLLNICQGATKNRDN